MLIIKIIKSYTTFIMNTHQTHTNNPYRMNAANQKKTGQQKEILYELKCLWKQRVEGPSPRTNSQLVYYKNKLYLYGGQQHQHETQRSVSFYSYDLDSNKWSAHFSRAFTHILPKFSPKISVIAGNKWFMLGSECQSSTQKETAKLWRLNFDFMDWITLQQKGETIKQLQGGSLVSFQKNFLVYYGGYSYFQNMCNNNVYLYNVDSKTWYRCSGSYQNTVKSRFFASMVNVNGKIFLYGGYYKHADHLQCLDEFYEITLKLPSKGVHPQAYFRQISTSTSPSPRAQHYLFAVDSNSICLFGGKNSQPDSQTELWSYYIITDQWMLIDRIQDAVNQREGSSVAMGGNTIYIFGGIQQKLGVNERLRGDLWSLNVNYNRLYGSEEQVDKLHSVLKGDYSHNCKICYQKKHNFFMNAAPKFSSEIIDGAVSSISFPYAAFGLLIDKSISLGATVINISIEGQQSTPYIYIEDNPKTLLSQQELLSCLYGFEGNINMIMSGCDKKIKKQILKDNLLKEFGINLKMGALRLGKKFLFVSGNGEAIHLFLCFKDTIQNQEQTSQNNQETDKQVYMFHYYAIDADTKQLIKPQMQSSRQFIESRYRKQVKLVTASKAVKNTLFIFETFLNSKEQPVSVSYENNDVIYGDKAQIEKLTSYGYNMNEFIDVSLRAYLSLLYLRCEQIEINFGLKHSSAAIISQPYLQKIDKACRTGHIIELQDVLQFDLKLVEMYWQRQLKRNSHFFSNGLLIYSKNRLICRYRIELGGLLPIMAKQVTALTNYLPFFGYAQLPEHIPVNLFKTGFSFNILIEKLFSRIKFVEQGFKKRQALLLNVSRSSKNGRRERLGDEYLMGSKKKSRRLQSTNTPYMQLPMRIVKDKDKKATDPSNMPFFIKQNIDENKSDEQVPHKKAELDSQHPQKYKLEKDKKEKVIQLNQSQQQ